MINWWLVKFVQILDWSSDYFAHWKLRLKTSTQCHTVVTLTASWLHRYKSVNNTHISDELEISPLFPHAADRYFFVADTGAWDNFAETWGLGKRDSFVAKMGDTQIFRTFSGEPDCLSHKDVGCQNLAWAWLAIPGKANRTILKESKISMAVSSGTSVSLSCNIYIIIYIYTHMHDMYTYT